MKPRTMSVFVAMLAGCLAAYTVKAAEPSFELTARYILEVVKAFRTAYVLKVVEHAKDSGVTPNENWQSDAHFIPLPAQFVKAAADQLDDFEIGLIGLTPVNQANYPRTQAESDALIQLMKNRGSPSRHSSMEISSRRYQRILPSCSLVWIATTTTPKPPDVISNDGT